MNYNIYYKGTKLNNRPLSESDIIEIKNKKTIYKRNQIFNELEEIPTKDISYIKTIII